MRRILRPAAGIGLLLVAALQLSVAVAPPLLAAPPALAAPSQAAQGNAGSELDKAHRELEAGEADAAEQRLQHLLQVDQGNAEAWNLLGRVAFTLRQWSAAVNDCQQAVTLDPANSRYHLWLARALGEHAGHASFLTAFGLARRAHQEFTLAVQRNPRDTAALVDLAEFDMEAPSMLGGGLDKAEGVARQLDEVDARRAHELRAELALKEGDPARAAQHLKQAMQGAPHPAFVWLAMARLAMHQKQWIAMGEALHQAADAAARDPQATIVLYDAASLMARTHQQTDASIRWMEMYVASPTRTEEGPAFEALLRLAHWYDQTGNRAKAAQDRAEAKRLAHSYTAEPES